MIFKIFTLASHGMVWYGIYILYWLYNQIPRKRKKIYINNFLALEIFSFYFAWHRLKCDDLVRASTKIGCPRCLVLVHSLIVKAVVKCPLRAGLTPGYCLPQATKQSVEHLLVFDNITLSNPVWTGYTRCLGSSWRWDPRTKECWKVHEGATFPGLHVKSWSSARSPTFHKLNEGSKEEVSLTKVFLFSWTFSLCLKSADLK